MEVDVDRCQRVAPAPASVPAQVISRFLMETRNSQVVYQNKNAEQFWWQVTASDSSIHFLCTPIAHAASVPGSVTAAADQVSKAQWNPSQVETSLGSWSQQVLLEKKMLAHLLLEAPCQTDLMHL